MRWGGLGGYTGPMTRSSTGQPHLSSSPLSKSLSRELAGIELPDADGVRVRLGSLWERQPAVVVFLRHYG